ncbi:MAG: thymidylate kinase [Firmicutes bacterium]|nr:thymidylate kinase [Bacillota bacterium]
MAGKLIVIEGTDCSGKNTQSILLAKKLNAMGYKAINLSFPMYDTPTGKIIGGPLLGRKEDGDCWFPEGPVNVDPKISGLLYAADRKYNFPRIEKYLNEGYYVILDRYVSSNMAHQGSKIIDDTERFNFFRWIDKLEYWLLELPKADITIFLHVPFQYTKQLMENRNSLDLVEKDEHYLIQSEMTYMELSELYHWHTIDCVEDGRIKTVDKISEEIIEKILD